MKQKRYVFAKFATQVQFKQTTNCKIKNAEHWKRQETCAVVVSPMLIIICYNKW